MRKDDKDTNLNLHPTPVYFLQITDIRALWEVMRSTVDVRVFYSINTPIMLEESS